MHVPARDGPERVSGVLLVTDDLPTIHILYDPDGAEAQCDVCGWTVTGTPMGVATEARRHIMGHSKWCLVCMEVSTATRRPCPIHDGDDGADGATHP